MNHNRRLSVCIILDNKAYYCETKKKLRWWSLEKEMRNFYSQSTFVIAGYLNHCPLFIVYSIGMCLFYTKVGSNKKIKYTL